MINAKVSKSPDTAKPLTTKKKDKKYYNIANALIVSCLGCSYGAACNMPSFMLHLTVFWLPFNGLLQAERSSFRKCSFYRQIINVVIVCEINIKNGYFLLCIVSEILPLCINKNITK